MDSVAKLMEHIVPFFEDYPLVVKAADFGRFAAIVRSMERREHLTPGGFERVVHLAYDMNAQGRQRKRTITEILGDPQRLHAGH